MLLTIASRGFGHRQRHSFCHLEELTQHLEQRIAERTQELSPPMSNSWKKIGDACGFSLSRRMSCAPP
jgi:hypothetical protein